MTRTVPRTSSRRVRTVAVSAAVVVGLLSIVGCSDDDTAGSDDTTTTVTTAKAASCQREAEAPPDTVAVPGSTSDLDVTTFDGVTIRAHWFPTEERSSAGTAPTILMGPGWGLAGDTNPDAVGVLGAVNIGSLNTAGYHVLTWDPRGIGASTGTAQVDDADYEGRDVQRLLDWVASRPEAELDRPGDPRAGMVGGSYGGGIQLVTASIDCRVDAIVPIIAWHSLGTSLYKADTYKAGWANVLSQVSARASVDPHIPSANEAGNATGVIPPDDMAWFESKGPGDAVADIGIPTLIIQGTVDTLFTLDEGVTNYRMLQGVGVPVAMMWFCGGHGLCLTDRGDETRVATRAIAWFERYVRQDESVDTGPTFETLDQNGATYTGDDLPEPDSTIEADGSGTLRLVAEGGSGPVTPPAGASDMLTGVALPITPGPATNAVDVPVELGADADEPALVVGAPELSISYSGTVPDGERPTRVFAQLVDDATGLVIGNQVTPIAVTLDGSAHTAKLPLEMVSFVLQPGAKVRLQLVATTVTYGQPRLGGEVRFDEVSLTLPVVTGLTPNPNP